jgi:hypothetical protein
MVGTSQWTLDCGVVESVQDNVTVSLSTTPIVTYSAENAFVFDTGATNTYTFHIVRKNPIGRGEVIDDEYTAFSGYWENSERWSNRVWMMGLRKFINRWQARSDGCKLYFTPLVQDKDGYDRYDVYQRRLDGVNVYLKGVTFNYTVNSPEIIRATISVTLGSMCGKQRAKW